MDDRKHAASSALALMQKALALLDHAGESLAAVRLQHAIDTAACLVPPTADDDSRGAAAIRRV
jgi:hypothetical protein